MLQNWSDFKVSRGKEVLYSSVTCLISSQQSRFPIIEVKAEGRETHKQALSVSGGRKGLAEQLKGENTAFGDVHEVCPSLH